VKFYFHYIHINAEIDNNEMLSLYFYLPEERRGEMSGSGEIEFNVYSLHDVAARVYLT
jgi:hypothetical protein